ncbi:MAG: ABC transporter permease [Actinomycetota bacterium]
MTGLGAGAILAVLAIGLVLTFRASNVVNLAHCAMGMYTAFVYYGLRDYDVASTERGGDLVLPVIGLPARVHVVDRPTVVTALIISLIVAALLGVVVYTLVFRPLRTAPALARIVGSLGVFLYLQSVMQLRVSASGGGSAALRLGSLLPDGVVHIGSAVVPVSSFLLAGIAIVVALGLGVVYRYTRFGLATRAAAESEKGAVLSGISPDRVGVVNWALASVLAGAAVIAIAGVTSRLDPVETSLLVVPALAAALLGGLRSFGLTTVAGLAIGMMQSVLSTFQSRADWMPDAVPNGGLRQALPVILIVIAITARGARLPTRESVVDARLPASPTPRHQWWWALGLVSVTAVALLTLDAQWRLAIVVSTIAALIALSTVVVTGYVGQISLAQYAFAGLAAFTTAKLAVGGLGFPWAPLLAVLLTLVVGVLVGIPAVRVRGMTLALATLGAAVAIEQLVFASPDLNGISDVPAPRFLGIDFGFIAAGDANFRAAFGLLALGVLTVAVLAVANLRRSATGLRWLAVRSNERAAAAAGIDVAATKLSAFAVSSVLAGLGGALLAYELPALSPQQFMVIGALAVLALCFLGGIGTLAGALIAGLLASGGILTHLQGGATGNASSYQFAVSGVALVAVAVWYPDGIANAVRRGVARVRS